MLSPAEVDRQHEELMEKNERKLVPKRERIRKELEEYIDQELVRQEPAVFRTVDLRSGIVRWYKDKDMHQMFGCPFNEFISALADVLKKYETSWAYIRVRDNRSSFAFYSHIVIFGTRKPKGIREWFSFRHGTKSPEIE